MGQGPNKPDIRARIALQQGIHFRLDLSDKQEFRPEQSKPVPCLQQVPHSLGQFYASDVADTEQGRRLGLCWRGKVDVVDTRPYRYRFVGIAELFKASTCYRREHDDFVA